MTFLYCYRKHRFNSKAQVTVDQANVIIADMSSQGYTLSLRQLYYQFVRRNWLPNTEREYKRLGRLVTHARESGVMDWMAIEDRGRGIHGPRIEETTEGAVAYLEEKLNLDQWKRQDHYLEVWVEKQALEGVISRPCTRLDVRYMACKGYLSASEAWRAGLRFAAALERGQKPIMIHLADHDPSGLNMTEDNSDRLRLFAESHDVEIRRIALNMDQVKKYNPPPNPAKESDSRSKAYVKRFGQSSWELDALEPETLDELITGTIEEYLDRDRWEKTLEEEYVKRAPLKVVSQNWEYIQQLMRDDGLL